MFSYGTKSNDLDPTNAPGSNCDPDTNSNPMKEMVKGYEACLSLQKWLWLILYVLTRVADPHHLHADPVFHFNADPDQLSL
jgi:hypothetical protein